MKRGFKEALDAIAARAEAKNSIHNLQFEVAIPSQGFAWCHDAKSATKQFFIASATKLFTTALVYQLIDAHLISLDTRAVDILGPETMHGLHSLNGKDNSARITIRHLLSHTSGIADYFEQKPTQGKSLAEMVLENQDRSWSFDDILAHVRKNLRPRFDPDAGRGFYSDTNYQLLGRIIESLSGENFNDILGKKILQPLGLNKTFMFAPEMLNRYPGILPLYHDDQRLVIPQAMASFGCDGGMVSTTGDMLRFLEAFFTGKLFEPSWIQTAAEWRRIFFPLQYGVGFMRFQLPRIFTLFRKTPEFFGHSGASGTVAFYAPELDLYVCAAVNQTKYRDLPFRLLVEAGMAAARFRESSAGSAQQRY